MNKKKLIVIILLLMFIQYAFAIAEEHPIDKFEEECIKKNWTTSGMANCAHEAEAMWEQEVNKYYNFLYAELDDEGKSKLKASQEAWLQFKEAEFRNINHIYGSLAGSMYINIRSADTKALVRDRALSLKFYYEQYKEGKLDKVEFSK